MLEKRSYDPLTAREAYAIIRSRLADGEIVEGMEEPVQQPWLCGRVIGDKSKWGVK